MEQVIYTIETLADYKRAMKTFVRGVIKSKLFESDKPLEFIVEKHTEDNTIDMFIVSNYYSSLFCVKVSTRIFNKVEPELYTKTIEQFNKLKGFAGMTVTVK